ncbi:hypothetical protein F8M41_019496 [Gigaspora margarita]|uniref:Uncharacterized protein n=1 Tax=Gigaspora margarita TaxID=4874 RepID=A0A8H4AJU8_GIGMA|nr:hypothetical protein F8M41_019496 [Gigaspora margarita]
MSSLFIAFCFAKTVTGNNKFITGTALYRISSFANDFREFTYKGFACNSKTLVFPFEKNFIVFMVGRYIALVQTVPISCSKGDHILVPEDLPDSSSLLIYTASVVPNSYIPDNRGGCESFIMARRLYNSVTNNKNIDLKVIVSYTNEHNCYNSMKNNLKKTVLSVIGHLIS